MLLVVQRNAHHERASVNTMTMPSHIHFTCFCLFCVRAFISLSGLETLWLNRNMLTGTVPTELASLTNLGMFLD